MSYDYDYDYYDCNYTNYGCSPKVKPTHKWFQTHVCKPIEDRPIIGIDSGGTEHRLVYYKNMFFLRDKSMYVYFTPNMWRYDD